MYPPRGMEAAGGASLQEAAYERLQKRYYPGIKTSLRRRLRRRGEREHEGERARSPLALAKQAPVRGISKN